MIKHIICLLYTFMMLPPNIVVFDFNQNSDIQQWKIVDDVVMGGQSSGNFRLDNAGHGVFEGEVSLENNGGFSSLHYYPERTLVKGNNKIFVKLKGDGKNYQLRIKANINDYHSYIMPFSTTGDWQEIGVPLKEMYPSFRGRKLDRPNFSNGHFEEITFLIANKRNEKFQLLIDKITIGK